MSDFMLRPTGFGPGSQPAPDGELEYMPMPEDMRTYTPSLPEVEDTAPLRPALAMTATALPHVWRVQFFNSMDTLILDTFEVTAMPEVALAAPEDLADSAERLREVPEAGR